jgi:hypothetical protein
MSVEDHDAIRLDQLGVRELQRVDVAENAGSLPCGHLQANADVQCGRQSVLLPDMREVISEQFSESVFERGLIIHALLALSKRTGSHGLEFFSHGLLEPYPRASFRLS